MAWLLALPVLAALAFKSRLLVAFRLCHRISLGRGRSAHCAWRTGSPPSSRAATWKWSAWWRASRRLASARCASSSRSSPRSSACRESCCSRGIATRGARTARRCSSRRCIRASAGSSRCACAGRTATSIRTASTTRRGCSSAASAQPAMCGSAASASASAQRNHVVDYIQRAREAVRERFQAELGATPAAGILAALAVGDQRAISAEEWRLFNRTGVTHLMSISGLHVTLVSGLAAWLVSFGWRRVPARGAALAGAQSGSRRGDRRGARLYPARRLRRPRAAHLLDGKRGRRRVVVRPHCRAGAHARACARGRGRHGPLGAARAGAVAVVRRGRADLLRGDERMAHRAMGRMQWAITVGLAPAALLLFGQLSVAGPLANALAIPLVSVVITPLALLAVVVPANFVAGGCGLARRMAARLPGVVRRAARSAVGAAHPPVWAGGARRGGRGVDPRAARRPVARGRACAHGARVLARAARAGARRSLDHGARRRAGAGGARAHREPRAALRRGAGLRPRGRQRRAHRRAALAGDGSSQHRPAGPQPRGHRPSRRRAHRAGNARREGARLFAAANHPLQSLASVPGRCAAGVAWDWDGVRFEFLHPPPGWEAARRNNQSCVLRVAAGASSMLLTGDIERRGGRIGLQSRCCSRCGCPSCAAPWKPHVLERGIHRRGGAALGHRARRLSQPLRPPGARGAGALCESRRDRAAHRSGRRDLRRPRMVLRRT